MFFLYLFIFSAGCLSCFKLQANICGWSHHRPWQKTAIAMFACVAMVAIKLSWLEGKAENLGGSDERVITCGLKFYSPSCSNQSVNSPISRYDSLVHHTHTEIGTNTKTSVVDDSQDHFSLWWWNDHILSNCLISLSLSLSLCGCHFCCTPPAMCLLADPEALSAATGISTPTEREGQPSGSRICLMLDSP